MKAFGVRRKDRGCCPGHDKYPDDTYSNKRSKRAHSRARHQAHSAGRAQARQSLLRDLNVLASEDFPSVT